MSAPSNQDPRIDFPPHTRLDDDDDGLQEAAREAERARQSFHESLVEASESSRAVVRRAVAGAKPLIIGVLVLGGAAVLVSAARLARRSRARGWMDPPRRPGIFGSLIRSMATRLVVAGAVKVAQHYLLPPPEEAGAPPPPEPGFG
jgi:hypothetical protein